MDIISKVAVRLKLDKEQTVKLRSTAALAGANNEEAVLAVYAGLQKGSQVTAKAKEALKAKVEYPARVDECPVCYGQMESVRLAADRPSYFCPVHNVCMPAV